MAHIDVEYTLTVKIPEIFLDSTTSRDEAERKIKDMARQRIIGWASGSLFDPQGKVFTEAIKVIPK
jgi:hypothetical protein